MATRELAPISSKHIETTVESNNNAESLERSTSGNEGAASRTGSGIYYWMALFGLMVLLTYFFARMLQKTCDVAPQNSVDVLQSESCRLNQDVFGEEAEIWTGAPSYLYYFGYFIAGVILLPLFGVGLLLILYAVLERNSNRYTLTKNRIVSKTGIVSRNLCEVGARDIRNINVKQGILERVLGLGTVEIGSAGTAGIEVSFFGVREPMRVRDAIRKAKDNADLGR